MHEITWDASTDPDGDSITYDIGLSTDNGVSWSSIATGVSGTSHSYDFSVEPSSDISLIRVRAVDVNNEVSAWDESDATFTINRIPNPPSLNSPLDGSSHTLDSGFTFNWGHDDPDGDLPVEYAFKRRNISTGAAWEWWDAANSQWVASELWNDSYGTDVAFSGGQWPLGTYEWTVATGSSIVVLWEMLSSEYTWDNIDPEVTWGGADSVVK